MQRYPIQFEKLGTKFWIKSPAMISKQFAETWGKVQANRNAVFGWSFVKVGERKEVVGYEIA